MKVLRLINAIIYLVAIVFIILSLFKEEWLFKMIWWVSFGIASMLLLIIAIIQLVKDKHAKKQGKK